MTHSYFRFANTRWLVGERRENKEKFHPLCESNLIPDLGIPKDLDHWDILLHEDNNQLKIFNEVNFKNLLKFILGCTLKN